MSLWIILAATLFFAGCQSEIRQLDVRIVDSSTRPVAGAIFYAEAFIYNEQAFDFAWGHTDSDGYVHDADGEVLTLKWKSEAKLAHAAFAPGMKPAGFIDHIGTATDRAFSVILHDTSTTDLDYQPVLAKLSFPFESKPDLAKRLKEPANRELLLKFREAYEPLVSGDIPSMPEELAKLRFLDSLLTGSSAAH